MDWGTTDEPSERWPTPVHQADRREFLKAAGVLAAAIGIPTLVGGCRTFPFGHGETLNFHEDFGVLNYAYALETLEARFYRAVVMNPALDLRPGELDVLRDIATHEAVHQRFFRRALGPFAIRAPDTDFGRVDFRSRDSVLTTAKMFEDLGVAAYNGAGRRLRLAEFLTIAGKIVSVEARHASAIRDLLNPGSRDFAGDDVIDDHGYDRALPPDQVLAQARPYFKSDLRIVGL